MTAALILAGCQNGAEEPEVAVVETVSGFAGVAVADEPRAAMVGREILGNNGNAIDAAVAMSFTMAVTLPSRVGLGGGGACVVHKRDAGKQDSMIFLPSVGENGAAVPGLARGMAALHARYGLRAWSQLVSPAERLAALGYKVSRAFRTDLETGQRRLGDQALQSYLRGRDLPAVGDSMTQPGLATVLAGLRRKGAGHLHTGTLARQFAEEAGARGAPLTVKDLLDYRPAFAEPLSVAYGEHRLYLPPAPVTGSVATGQLLQAIQRADIAPETPEYAGFVANAWTQVLADRQARTRGGDTLNQEAVASLVAKARNGAAVHRASLGTAPHAAARDIPTAGLTAADRFGNVVACGLTMNGLFGTGRVAGGTGILLAEARQPEVAGAALAPVLVANPNTDTGYVAATAAGGVSGQPALAQLLAMLEGGATSDAPAPGPGLFARGAGGMGRPVKELAEPTSESGNLAYADTRSQRRRRPISSLGETVSDSGGNQAGGESNVSRRPISELGRSVPDNASGGNGSEAGFTGGGDGLKGLLGLARFHPTGHDGINYEPGFGAARLDALRRAGHDVNPAEQGLGILSLLNCPRGAHVAPERCEAAADPRWHGLAVRAQ